jgi:hypothetical protein
MAASMALPILVSLPNKLIPAIPPVKVPKEELGRVGGIKRPPAA